jgi:methanethiol S-methyltransferase
MKRISIFVFGVLSYAAFFLTFCYAMGFVGRVVVPKDINTGATAPFWEAVLINSLMLSAFVIQHTIMARPAFKVWFTRFVPKPMERSIFVLAASSILAVTFWLWRPLPEVMWQVNEPMIAYALTGISWMGWVMVLLSSFLINHFDLFGLRQVWLQMVNKSYTTSKFRLTSLYRFVRHPLMLGFLIAFWSTPVMTQGHLLFAVLTTGYILMGIQFEERDLIREHGEAYRRYREAVPMLLPYKGDGAVRMPAPRTQPAARHA